MMNGFITELIQRKLMIKIRENFFQTLNRHQEKLNKEKTMGLDMFFYKLSNDYFKLKEKQESLSAQFEKISKEEITTYNDMINKSITEFINRNREYLSEHFSDSYAHFRLRRNVELLITIDLNNQEGVAQLKWSLFNYFSIFNNLIIEHDSRSDNKISDKILDDFIKTFSFIKFNKKLYDILQEINEINEIIYSELNEILYFRKYYKLNDALKERLPNFEDGAFLPLTKEDMIFVRDFIKNDSESLENNSYILATLDNVIKNWSDDYTYVYNPDW